MAYRLFLFDIFLQTTQIPVFGICVYSHIYFLTGNERQKLLPVRRIPYAIRRRWFWVRTMDKKQLRIAHIGYPFIHPAKHPVIANAAAGVTLKSNT